MNPRKRDDRILDTAKTLKPSDRGLSAQHLREVAGSIRDHRQNAANQGDWSGAMRDDEVGRD